MNIELALLLGISLIVIAFLVYGIKCYTNIPKRKMKHTTDRAERMLLLTAIALSLAVEIITLANTLPYILK